MKKFTALFLLISMIFTFTACGGNTSSLASTTTSTTSAKADTTAPQTEADATTTTEISQNSANTDTNTTKTLVAYFSRAGENYNVGNVEKGNTNIVADMIAEETNADTFEIARSTPYPESYEECTEEAKQEQNANARPTITATIDNFDDYDVIFIGYPIWWGDMPMPVYTFLESYDFSGKTVIPFCTHEGSGLSSTESSIASTCAGANVLEGLSITGSTAQNEPDTTKQTVDEWLGKLDIK